MIIRGDVVVRVFYIYKVIGIFGLELYLLEFVNGGLGFVNEFFFLIEFGCF